MKAATTFTGILMATFANTKGTNLRLDLGKQEIPYMDGDEVKFREEQVHASYFPENMEIVPQLLEDFELLKSQDIVPKLKLTGVKMVLQMDKATGDFIKSKEGQVNVTLRQSGNKRPTVSFVIAREKNEVYKRPKFLDKLKAQQEG